MATNLNQAQHHCLSLHSASPPLLAVQPKLAPVLDDFPQSVYWSALLTRRDNAFGFSLGLVCFFGERT